MMSTSTTKRPATKRRRRIRPEQLILSNGDRMMQREFHRAYLTYPEDVKFELIGGIVYMPSPMGRAHAFYTEELGFLLGSYRRATPGVEILPGATTILGEFSEPQPDLTLRILPEHGGQSRNQRGDKTSYVEGPPELLAEIAASTRAIDLHAKRQDYESAGVIEYIVVCVEEQELFWFHFPSGRNLARNAGGLFKSVVFPGLWIHGPALLDRDSERLERVLRRGLATSEHAAFVQQLKSRGKR